MTTENQEPDHYIMTTEETAAYRIELRNELAELELAQAFHWSEYKHDRINRLRSRLNMPTVPEPESQKVDK